MHGRYDTTGAVRSVQSIVGALPWRQSAEVLELLGDVDDDGYAAAYELGGTLAALTATWRCDAVLRCPCEPPWGRQHRRPDKEEHTMRNRIDPHRSSPRR